MKKKMYQTIKLFLGLCIISLCSYPVHAQSVSSTESKKMDHDIEEFIQEFYKDTWKKGETSDRYIYLSKYLSGLITDDYKSKIVYLSDGTAVFSDSPKLDFNPFIRAQDTPDDLKVEITSILNRKYSNSGGVSKATIIVNLFCFGEGKQIKYNLVTENNKWVIDNTIYEYEGRESFNLQEYMKRSE